ncbi:hypothetical protein [Desulfonatronum lacustre]|uniref:hypothetical protein n=1 Tax=Desulfonatronum lacustre TaxID=66849 RepID=UPI00048AB21B|nr:hypothetical protein [Desulfonatronum lacustre]
MRKEREDQAGRRGFLRKSGKGSGLEMGLGSSVIGADFGEDSGHNPDRAMSDPASMRVPGVRPADYVSVARGFGRAHGLLGLRVHLAGGGVAGVRAGSDGSGVCPPPPAPFDPPRPRPGDAEKFFPIDSPSWKRDWIFCRNLLAGTDPARKIPERNILEKKSTMAIRARRFSDDELMDLLRSGKPLTEAADIFGVNCCSSVSLRKACVIGDA